MKRAAALLAGCMLLLAACGGARQQQPQIHTHMASRFAALRYGDAANPVVGEVLTTTNGAWTNAPTGYTYQWRDCDSAGNACSNIAGATSSSYTIVTGDLTHTIRVVVTASNSAGSASQTSAQTGVVTSGGLASPTLTASAPATYTLGGSGIAASSISGVLASGSAPTGTITFKLFGPQASAPTTCTGGTTVGTASVSGNATYHPSAGVSDATLTSSGAGNYWWYASYGGDSGNNAAASTCGAGMAETVISGGGGGSAPSNTVQPYFTASTVSTSGTCSAGCAIQGQQLGVTTGTWANSPTSFSYQWKDCTTTAGTAGALSDASGANGHLMSLPTTGSCANATGTGATTNTYTVAAGDVGKALVPIVTATNASGSTPTVLTSPCNTGLEGNVPVHSGSGATNSNVANGIAGCSPISAVVAAAQTGQKFCTNAPITCGFADIANAGVPAGTTLFNVPTDCTSPSGPNAGCGATGSGWTYSAGEISVSAGGTLQDVRFTCGCATKASTGADVGIGVGAGSTIQDSDLTDYGINSEVVLLQANDNVTISHNNIHGIDALNDNGGCDSAARDKNNGLVAPSDNFTFTNNNVWFCSNPVNNFGFGGLIADNYMHGLGTSDNGAVDANPNHHEDIQMEDDRNQAVPIAMTIRNNTMYNEYDNETASLILSNDTGGIENKRTMTHNLIAGGGFCFYASGNGSTSTNLAFASNRWTPLFLDTCGGYGADTSWAAGTGDTWTSNQEDDNATTWNP